MKILALDMGKDKTVGCDFESVTGEHRFVGIGTSPGEIIRLLEEIAPNRVVIEIGPQAGWVADLVRGMEIELQVANPNHDAWRWRQVKAKTDRLDALKLARLSAMNQLPMVHVPERGDRQWRALIVHRQTLVTRRTAIKNRIRSVLEVQGLRVIKDGKSAWTQAALSKLRELARPLEQVELRDVWRGTLWIELEELDQVQEHIARVERKLDSIGQPDERVQRLQEIPGVGHRLAEAVVAFLGDPHRFKSGKQVGCYVGLTPRLYQSGKMDRAGAISGEGNRHLRSMLIEVSWLGLRWNPWMREVYERVCRGSKARKKIAIVAVARRLLVRCWAMLRDGTRWRPPEMVTQAA
jgi:transposase